MAWLVWYINSILFLKGLRLRGQGRALKPATQYTVNVGGNFMNKMILLLIFSVIVSCGQERPQDNCAILKEGTFKYLDDIGDTSAYFVIKNGQHIEYHRDKQYQIEPNMEWTGDCKYEMEMRRTNYENFPFKKGDKIKIQIKQVKGDTVYYTATVNEQTTWDSKVLRLRN